MDNNKTNNKKIGNVLLLTMSTLPRVSKLNATEYKYKLRNPVQGKEGYIKFSGYSQLEPIPISLNWRLSARNENLDRIVVINNDDTMTPQEKIILSSESSEEYSEMSAFDFFKERVKNYRYDSIEFYSNDTRFELNNVECLTPEIVSVKINDSNAIPGIYEVCDILRTYNKDCDELNLFLDIHGGLRSQQIMVDSVISILEHEGIAIHETYSTNGNPPEIEIVNADESINIFNLTSGVNEFINYGRSNSLIEYINGLEDEKKYDKDLTSAINEICNSLQLCRMEDFSDDIINLKRVLESYEKDGKGKLLPVINLIKQNYADLFKDENNLVSQIEWCVKHEFYQQALTIIESLIPGYLFNKGVVWYAAKRSKTQLIEFKKAEDFKNTILCKKNNNELEMTQIKFEKFICRCKSWWMEIENYIFEHCIDECVNECVNGRRVTLSLQETEEDYLRIPLRFDRTNCEDYKRELKTKANPQKKYGDRWVSDIWLRTSSDNHETFNRFAQIHFMIKNQRNLTNHAKANTEGKTDERADVKQIKTAINAYVNLLKLLLNTEAN